MNVLQSIVKGYVDMRKLTMLNIEGTRAEFQAEGIKFPTNEDLDFDTSSDWCVLLNPVQVYVQVKNGKEICWISFGFKRGFCWDLASVPRFFRSVVDNDAQESIVAAMCHDYLFTSHALSFRESNSVFRGLLKTAGASRFDTFIYWAAVSSPVGRYMYNSKTIKRAKWQLQTVDFAIERK